MAADIKGKTVTWGTNGAYSTGICQSASVQKQASTASVQGTDGEEVATMFYDTKTTISATCVCESGTSLPTIGSSITIGGSSCYVTNVTENWSNNAAKQFTVSAEKGDNVSASAG